MGKGLRYLLILTAFLGLQLLAYGQSSNYPPEPTMATDDSLQSPCGSGDGGQEGGIPPPVGLCLPINDYLLPLLVAGIALGTMYITAVKKEPLTNSTL